MSVWNPWHGCRKLSEGCRHCYVYRMDERYGRDSEKIEQNRSFFLPVSCKKNGAYRIPAGEIVYTCFSSDFFLDQADEWRPEAWRMIRERKDLHFLIITKRISRFYVGLPQDWENGYPNVTICCTVENQSRANERLPIFLNLPIRHKRIVCEPLLGPIELEQYLNRMMEQVIVGGESGPEARLCDYRWVLDLREQCVRQKVPFVFRQTGARLKKDGRIFRIPRKLQHIQAQKAGIDFRWNHTE